MKKIIAAVAVATSAFFIASCSTGASPVETVTVTAEPSVPIQPEPQKSPQQIYVDYVRINGGIYASSASDSSIINLGNIICDGYRDGLSEDDVTRAIAMALIENDMNNENGYVFAAALIVGAERYLCSTFV